MLRLNEYLEMQDVSICIAAVCAGTLQLLVRSQSDGVLTLLCRHLLRAVIRHHHAEHQLAQPQRQRQAARGALHLHEQRDQRRRGPPRGAAQGGSLFLITAREVTQARTPLFV